MMKEGKNKESKTPLANLDLETEQLSTTSQREKLDLNNTRDIVLCWDCR